MVRSISSQLTITSEASAWRNYRREKGTGSRGEKDCEAYLIKANAKLIQFAAKRYYPAGGWVGVCPDDIMASATIGLLKAIRSFDTSYGAKFSTHAFNLMCQECNAEVRIGRFYKASVNCDGLKLDKLSADFIAKHGREMDVAEVMAATGWGAVRSHNRQKMVNKRVLAFSDVGALAAKGNSKDGTRGRSTLGDANLELAYIDEDVSRMAWPPEMLVDGLITPDCFDPESLSAISTQLRRDIFTAYFLGQKHGDCLPTLQSVANEFGVTRERIRQVIAATVEQVKAYHEKKGVKVSSDPSGRISRIRPDTNGKALRATLPKLTAG